MSLTLLLVYLATGLVVARGYDATHPPHPGHAAGVITAIWIWPVVLIAELIFQWRQRRSR